MATINWQEFIDNGNAQIEKLEAIITALTSADPGVGSDSPYLQCVTILAAEAARIRHNIELAKRNLVTPPPN